MGNISAKPYFIKDTGQCFVRTHNSTRRIGRNAILNLFSNTLKQKESVERLRSSVFFLRAEVKKTLEFLNAISPLELSNTPPVDLTFVRDAVMINYSFLQNNELMTDKSYQSFTFVFHTLELLNTYITKFNESTTPSIRTGIKELLTGMSHIYSSHFNQVDKFLIKVIETCDKFLKKFDE